MKKADLLLISAALAVAVIIGLFVFFKSGSTAIIYNNGEVYKTIDLKTAENTAFTVNNVEIKVENGKIGVVNSDCHDKVCVKTGFIEKAGQTIACVPNGIVITVSGENGVDGVTG